MKILQMIEAGQYNRTEEPGTWNRMGSYMMRGGTRYDFGDGVSLKTYTGSHWFLYVDGELQKLPVSHEALTAAFEKSRGAKVQAMF